MLLLPQQQFEYLNCYFKKLYTMKANIGISEKNSKEVGSVLNKILADEYLLYTKTRNYHWNIEGSNFMEMHLFFESQYNSIDEAIDETEISRHASYSNGRGSRFIGARDTRQSQQRADCL